MPYGLYLSAEGAFAQGKRLEVIANNLANVDTVGFKRELAVCQARYAEAVEQGLQSPESGAIEDIGGGMRVRETKTDYAIGPLKETGIPTDVAVKGPRGFFVVQKGDETFLTRAGNFQITSRGELTTQQGYPVLNEAGVPVRINPNDPTWQITASGAVRQAAGAQNLALVEPQSLEDLERVGENLFRPLSQPEPLAAAERSVAPGFLEGSAVKPATEMTALIEASRALEANVNLMKSQDEMLGGLINRLMRT